jgi:aryl-alcohol dehydrogenase-like predicted oxidoreductase
VDLVDAKPQENNMQTVTLGATRLEVTPIAYGTWQFGGDWGPVDERAAIAATGHARSLGINFFDTAQAYAADRGATIGQLAVAWVLAHPAVQVAIVGARTPAHLDESAGAAELRLSQDDLAEIDRIMAAAVPVGGPSPEGMT